MKEDDESTSREQHSKMEYECANDKVEKNKGRLRSGHRRE